MSLYCFYMALIRFYESFIRSGTALMAISASGEVPGEFGYLRELIFGMDEGKGTDAA